MAGTSVLIAFLSVILLVALPTAYADGPGKPKTGENTCAGMMNTAHLMMQQMTSLNIPWSKLSEDQKKQARAVFSTQQVKGFTKHDPITDQRLSAYTFFFRVGTGDDCKGSVLVSVFKDREVVYTTVQEKKQAAELSPPFPTEFQTGVSDDRAG